MLDAAQARWTTCWPQRHQPVPSRRARVQPGKHPHHRPSGGYGSETVPGFLVVAPTPICGTRRGARPPSTEVAKAYLDHICSFASNGGGHQLERAAGLCVRCARSP